MERTTSLVRLTSVERALIRLGVITAGALAVVSCGTNEGATGSSGSLAEPPPLHTVEPAESFDPETTLPGAGATNATAPADPDASIATGSLPFGLALCGEFQVVSADPAFYRDSPAYVANEQPIDEIRSWASQQPGYVDLWIDRDNLGWVVVGFDADVEQRQADLEAQFPGVGVAAAEVPHTQDEVDALIAEVFDVMRANGIEINGGANAATGQASAYVGVLDEATLEPFAPFAGRPVCFEGVDPADAVIDGPQPLAGDGWSIRGDTTGHPQLLVLCVGRRHAGAIVRTGALHCEESPPVAGERLRAVDHCIGRVDT
ncbi:MAG: hypothetical protein AAFY28_00305, partial [Actinomycetota bacterium]